MPGVPVLPNSQAQIVWLPGACQHPWASDNADAMGLFSLS